MKNSLRWRLAAAGAAAALLLTTNTAVALPAAVGSHGAAPAAGAATLATPAAEPNIPPCPSPPIVGRGNGPALPNSDVPCQDPPTTPNICDLHTDKDVILDDDEVGLSAIVVCDENVKSISIVVDIYRRTTLGSTLIARERVTVRDDHFAYVTASTTCKPGTHTYYGTAQATVDEPPPMALPKVTTPNRTYTC
jgi:hypothetical protein